MPREEEAAETGGADVQDCVEEGGYGLEGC